MLWRSDVAWSLNVRVEYDVNCNLSVIAWTKLTEGRDGLAGKEVGYNVLVTGTRSNQGKVAKNDRKRREQR